MIPPVTSVQLKRPICVNMMRRMVIYLLRLWCDYALVVILKEVIFAFSDVLIEVTIACISLFCVGCCDL